MRRMKLLQSLASRWCSCGTGKGRQWRASSHQIYPLLPTSQPQHRRIRRVCAEFWLVTQSPIHHGRHLQKIQFHALKSVMFVQFPLQLALDSARFEFTLKMRLNRIWPKDPTYAIFLKSWVFKDVKYDIPMCQYHSTRPQPIQLVPTMQKSSLRHHFRRNSWKLGSQNLHVHGHFWCTCKFSFFPVFTTPRGIFGQKCVTMCHL